MTIKETANDYLIAMTQESWNGSLEILERLLSELDAARKVAEAAVKWQEADKWTQIVPFFDLIDVIREYRALSLPLSPAKQAELAGALAQLDDEQALEKIAYQQGDNASL